jgi:hypothetical protein
MDNEQVKFKDTILVVLIWTFSIQKINSQRNYVRSCDRKKIDDSRDIFLRISNNRNKALGNKRALKNWSYHNRGHVCLNDKGPKDV